MTFKKGQKFKAPSRPEIYEITEIQGDLIKLKVTQEGKVKEEQFHRITLEHSFKQGVYVWVKEKL